MTISYFDLCADDHNNFNVRKKSLIIKVLVFDLDTNEQIREHKINFFDEKQAKWFSDMLFWATMNYKYVRIYNIKDVP